MDFVLPTFFENFRKELWFVNPPIMSWYHGKSDNHTTIYIIYQLSHRPVCLCQCIRLAGLVMCQCKVFLGLNTSVDFRVLLRELENSLFDDLCLGVNVTSSGMLFFLLRFSFTYFTRIRHFWFDHSLFGSIPSRT